jgi:GDP-4-dehydro-6-deoxy-D-mannose reductase
MKVLITGASGFVGRYLIKELLLHGDTVLATSPKKDSLNKQAIIDWIHKEQLIESSYEKNRYESILSEHLTIAPLDIESASECIDLLSRFKPEIIYHLAAISSVPEAEDDFKKAVNVNVVGTHTLFKVCHLLRTNIKVIFISSGEVYGRIREQDLPINETVATRPANNYSLTKLMAEACCNRYTQYDSVQSVILRAFNHIGPGQDERFVASSFAKQLAKIALKKCEPVISVGNLDSCRDFSDVRDIVRAYRLAGERGAGIYNLGSGIPLKIKDLLLLLIEIAGIQVTVSEDPKRKRPAEVPSIYCSYAKALSELGWKPQFSIRKSLEDVFRYWYEKERSSTER